MSARQPALRRAVSPVRIVLLVVMALSLYLLSPSVVATFAALPGLSSVDPRWLAVVLAGQVLSFTCVFALQRLALGTRAWFPVVTSQLAGNAVSRIVPGGAAAGAAVQLRMLADAGIDATAAVTGLTAFSLLQTGSILALPLLALPAVLGSAYTPPPLVQAAIVGGFAFVFVAALGFVVLATDRPLSIVARGVQRVVNRLRRSRPPLTGLAERVVGERDVVRAALGTRWRRAALAVAGKLGFDFASLLAALAAVGAAPNAGVVLLAFAASLALGMIPITPGGLGFVEAGLYGALSLAGVPSGQAVLATLIYRLASFWLPLLVGPVAYAAFRRRYRRPVR